MPTQLQGYDKVLFDRHAISVMAQHMTELEQAHLRKFKFPAQLNAAGRFMYNQTGRGFDWRLRYKLHDVTGYSGANRRTFAPTNLYKMAALEDRGYTATDAISEIEVLQARGSEALIGDIFSDFVGRIVESMEQHLARQYFVDGNLAANADFWHGLESMFGTNGTINVSTGAQRASNVADLVAYPSDTYADLSTELSAYGGSQISGVWPNGDADRQRDFFSPIMVVGDSTAFSGTTWQANSEEAVRFGISQASRNVGVSADTTTIFLDRQMYIDFKNNQAGKEEIQVSGNDSNSLRSLGFRDVIMLDGAEVTHETGVPVDVGYGFNYDLITGRSLYGNIIEPEGPQWDMDEATHKAAVKVLGNLKFRSPRNFLKFFRTYSDIT